jgi:hypothetical protein
MIVMINMLTVLVYLMLKKFIHSFQQTKAVRMEQTIDGTMLKSPFVH